MGLIKRGNVEEVTVLFDGDILVYRAGFAAEKRAYTIDHDLTRGLEWKSSKEVKAIIASTPSLDETMIKSSRKLEPLENALHNVDKMIGNTQANLSLHYGVEHDDVDVVVFLTGCNLKPNFRENVAHTYKMNRNPAHKPTYLNEIRAYIQNTYPTVMTQGAETDDYLCQAAKDTEQLGGIHKKAVIATIDKDLLGVPGTHYHPIKNELQEVDEDGANLHFFCQTLIGDTADNIVGVKGVGEMKAHKLLDQFKEQPETMFAVCLLQYQQTYGSDFLDEWNKNAELLWIWRTIPGCCPWLLDNKNDAQDAINLAVRVNGKTK